MKRIVVEELANGKTQYRVETDRKFFGLIKTKWHTDTTSHYMADGDYVTVNAVFEDLIAARICAGFPIEENQVVSRNYIYE
jgi:hypothetical protein